MSTLDLLILCQTVFEEPQIQLDSLTRDQRLFASNYPEVINNKNGSTMPESSKKRLTFLKIRIILRQVHKR